MTINTEQKKTLQNVSEQLLDTLARVADVARFQFNKTVTGASGSVLASQYNPMVGGQLAEQNLASIISQNSYNLQRMQAEPFVARLVVRWEDQTPPQEEKAAPPCVVAGRVFPAHELVSLLTGKPETASL